MRPAERQRRDLQRLADKLEHVGQTPASFVAGWRHALGVARRTGQISRRTFDLGDRLAAYWYTARRLGHPRVYVARKRMAGDVGTNVSGAIDATRELEGAGLLVLAEHGGGRLNATQGRANGYVLVLPLVDTERRNLAPSPEATLQRLRGLTDAHGRRADLPADLRRRGGPRPAEEPQRPRTGPSAVDVARAAAAAGEDIAAALARHASAQGSQNEKAGGPGEAPHPPYPPGGGEPRPEQAPEAGRL